jgi:transmembrane sensor
VALVCSCAACNVPVGQVWGTLLQVVGVQQRVSASKEIMVSAGQQLSIEGKTATLRDLTPEAMTQRLAWAGIRLKDGWVAFEGQTLASVVAEFNRYNDSQLVIGEPATAGLRVGGKFRISNVNGFVAALALTHGVRSIRTRHGSSSPQVIILVGGESGTAQVEGPPPARTAH